MGAVVVAACGAFGSTSEETPSTTDAAAAGEAATESSVPDGVAADSPSHVAKCNGATFPTAFFFAATSPLLSARLGVDGVLYVSRLGAPPALGTTKLTGGSIDTVAPLLQPAGDDTQAMLSADGLVLVFQSKRGDANGPYRLWFATRDAQGSDLQPPVAVPFGGAALPAATEMQDPWLTPAHLYFTSAPTMASAKALQVGDLDSASSQITNVRDVLATKTASVDHPVLSVDELELFYSEKGRIKRSIRPSTSVAFPEGAELTDLTALGARTPTWLSPDGCDLYFFGATATNSGLFRASRP
jgi:hypothetical protein